MENKTISQARSENIYLIYLFALFFLAQFFYYLAHAGFHSAFFGTDPFVMDANNFEMMKSHFWQSIFYYHLAPPLYVIYAALFKMFFPPYGEAGFYFLHSLLGVYSVYCLYKIQRKLDIHPVLAVFLTSVFVLSPGFNLAQSIAFYDFPTACLLTISVWHFFKLLDNPGFITSLTFFSIVAMVCGIRSLYHILLYMAPVILITLIVLKKHWKMILLGSLIPFLLVFSTYLKNYILFDAFTTSSYFGETLDTIVMQFFVTLEQREEGIQKGFFSDLALCPSTGESTRTPTINSKFSGWYCYNDFAGKYRDAYIKKLGRDYSNIPVLSCAPQQTDIPGFLMVPRNCVGNIGMSKEYGKNAIQAIIHYPASYWSGVKGAWRQYFNTSVSSYYEIMRRNLPEALSGSWLRLPLLGIPDPRSSISFPLLFAFPLLLFFAVCYTLYSRKGVLYFLGFYLVAFGATVYVSAKHFAGSTYGDFLIHWDMQAGLIVRLLFMFVTMTGIALLTRAVLPLLSKRSFTDSLLWPAADFNKRMVVLYLLGNIIFTTMVITLLVGLAQQRYRFYIDGMYLLLLALFIQTIIKYFSSRT